MLRLREPAAPDAAPNHAVASDGLLRRAARGASWSIMGTTVARFATLAAALFAARLLGSEHFGRFVLVQATLGTLSLGGVALGLAATKLLTDALAGNPRAAGSQLASIFVFCAAVGSFLTTVTFLVAPLLADHVLDRPDLTTTIRVGAPLLFLSPFVDVAIGALTGAHEFRRLGAVNALRGLATGAGIVLGASIGDVPGALIGYGIAEALTAVVGLRSIVVALARHGVRLRIDSVRHSARQVAMFSLPAMSGSILLQVALWLCQLLLSRQPNGLQLVGIFSIANKWYLAALFIPTAAGSVLLPMLGALHTAENEHDFRRLLRTFVGANLAITVPATLVLVAVAPLLIGVQGDGFSSGATTLRLLALAVVPTALNTVLSQAAIARKRIVVWLFSDVVLAVVLTTATVVLIPRHGAHGLAIAYTLAYSATCLAILPALMRGPMPRPAMPRIALSRPTFPRLVIPRTPIPRTPIPNAASDSTGGAPLWPAVALFYAFVAVVVLAKLTGRTGIDDLPALVAGPVCFVLVQACLPRSRPARDHLMSPKNFAWAFFASQLVLQPVMLTWYPPALGVLPTMPSASGMNVAIVLHCIAFASYALALTVQRDRPDVRVRPPLPLDPGRGVAFAFIGLGVVGTWLRFRSFGTLVQYFTLRGGSVLWPKPLSTTAIEVLGQLARPFGAYGCLILFWKALQEPRSLSRTMRIAMYGVGAFAAVASFDYNRASIVMPLLAAVATYSRYVRKIPARRLVAGLVLLLFAAVMFGEFRRIEIGTQGGRFSREDALLDGPGTPLQENIEVYGSAPQFTAIVIDHVDNGGSLTYGRSMFASALSPLPLLGEAFRNHSGNTEFNDLIYGPGGPRDQVIPFHAELYWNFGAAGVVVGFFCLGLAIAALDRRWRATAAVLDGYIVQYLSIWTAFLVVGQVLSYTQVWFYFGWPIIVLALLRSMRRPTTTRVGARVPARTAPGALIGGRSA